MISQAAGNAILNASSAVLLGTGYVMIRNKRVRAHKACMLTAVGTSTAFLLSYVIYHLRVGVVRFQGPASVRPAYLTMLTTHTILAVVIVPLVAVTLVRAFRSNFRAHRRIARWTLPVWAYVSVTGVLIYIVLYQLYPASHP